MNHGELPYGGKSDPNSGYAGSETSRARAKRDDDTGVTAGRWAATRQALAEAGIYGVTYKDLERVLNVGHGAASGVLSNMHGAGEIARLATKRDRCKVYVALNYVGGREVEPHGETARTEMLAAMYDLLNEADRIESYGGRDTSDLPPDWFERATDVMRRFEAVYGVPDE